MLTAAVLRQRLSYDPSTGLFTRISKHPMARTVRLGEVAGYLDRSTGYRVISVDGERYYAHRLAWLYVYGEWPALDIDHRDLDKDNNRWNNLRQATDSQNQANVGKRKGNKSGYKGVSRIKANGLWRMDIKYKGEHRHVDNIDCPAAAHFFYIVASDELHREFARPQ